MEKTSVDKLVDVVLNYQDELKEYKNDNRDKDIEINTLEKICQDQEIELLKNKEELYKIKAELKEKTREIKKLENPELYCSICLETSEDSKDIDFVSLACSHKIHLNCYIDYISSADKISHCPLCRTPYELPNIVKVLQKLKNKLNVAFETETYLREESARLRRIIYRYPPPPPPRPNLPRPSTTPVSSGDFTEEEEEEQIQSNVGNLSVSVSLPGDSTNMERQIISQAMDNVTNMLNNNELNENSSFADILNAVTTSINLSPPSHPPPLPPLPPRGNRTTNVIPNPTVSPLQSLVNRYMQNITSTDPNLIRRTISPTRIPEPEDDDEEKEDIENDESVNVDIESPQTVHINLNDEAESI